MTYKITSNKADMDIDAIHAYTKSIKLFPTQRELKGLEARH